MLARAAAACSAPRPSPATLNEARLAMNISVAATNVSIDSKLHTLLAIEECSSTDVIAGDATGGAAN